MPLIGNLKYILPTLHLGRTRTDVCNACFSQRSTNFNNMKAMLVLLISLGSLCKIFGAGLALPRYGGDQSNADYYASNLIVNNMNFVNCANSECVIYYYEERVAGKNGNSVTSLRWKNLCQFIIQKKEQELLPTAEVKILDNCVGQNKSNTTHKFSMLVSLFIFPDGVSWAQSQCQ